MEIVSSIIGIFPWVWDKSATQVNYLRKLHENLTSLSTSLDKLRDLRDTVKKKVENAETNSLFMKRNPQVAGWLRRVESEEREVALILQDGSQQLKAFCVLTGCFCCCRPKNNCCTGYKLGKKVVKKLASVDKLTGEGVFTEVVNRSLSGFVQGRPTNQQIVGMDPLLEKIWRLVTMEGQSKIIGLYGMGGVGKTTLLSKLNNEFLREDRHDDFDLVLWVLVSKDSDENVQKKIGDSLGLSWKEGTDQHSRANDIFNTLSKRKFVLLLDDVWQRVDLQSIGIPLHLDTISSSTTHGTTSKVVFTTRSEIVCGDMDADRKIKVECLDWPEAWSLFQEKVGQETLNCHPKVPELAEIVAKECGGLPLTLVTIGRTMASKKTPKEWEYAIAQLKKSASDFSGMDQVFSKLKFSYDNLENDKIRNCFLYCSLYPEDFQIEKNELIDLWIGEGFLTEFDDIEEARNEGHYVIGCLLGACLLESVASAECRVKMHDVIRDLATWVASDCGKKKGKSLVIQPSNELKVDEWDKAERISLVKHNIISLIKEPISCLNLLTLLLQYGSFRTISNDFFKLMPILKVLDMSNPDSRLFQKMPTSITSLVELEYLNVSGVYHRLYFVAGWLRSLVKLKFLDLSYTSSSFLEISPGEIACFTKLKMLDLYNSGLTNWEVEGGPSLRELEGLKSLSYLGISITGHALQTLVSSHKLRLCTRRLLIHVDINVTPLALIGLANLINLKDLYLKNGLRLHGLRISCMAGNEENITFPTSLETLTIEEAPNLNFVWDLIPQPRQFCFINLQQLVIDNCGALLKDLTWLIYAQCLKRLFLSSLDELEEIISDGIAPPSTQELEDEKYSSNAIFSSLKILYLSQLDNLRSICLHPLAFPCLELIYVEDCKSL